MLKKVKENIMNVNKNSAGRQVKHSCFTLIELLVVIAIIAILAAMLLPVLQKATARSNATTCTNNLGQIGKAFSMYQMDWGSYFPGQGSGTGLSWMNLLGKYMGIKTDDKGFFNPDQELPVFKCPEDETPPNSAGESWRNKFASKGGCSYASNQELTRAGVEVSDGTKRDWIGKKVSLARNPSKVISATEFSTSGRAVAYSSEASIAYNHSPNGRLTGFNTDPGRSVGVNCTFIDGHAALLNKWITRPTASSAPSDMTDNYYMWIIKY